MPDAKPPTPTQGFSWPPRSPDANRPPDHGDSPDWHPPGAATPADAPTKSGLVPAARPPRPWTRWLHACEEVWLARTAAPVAWRESLGELKPESPGSYCPRCGGSVGPFEADADGCRDCRDVRLPWSRAVRLGSYEGTLRECIHLAKFGGWHRLQTELGRRLGRVIAEALREARLPGPYWVVPVPTTTARRLERGMDHTLVLSRSVARALGGRVVRPLRRVKPAAQTGASASERARLAAGAFRPRRGWWMGIRRGVWRGTRGWGEAGIGCGVVIVVDDVRTTGATLRAACRGLRAGARRAGAAPARVWVATMGVTEREGAR